MARRPEGAVLNTVKLESLDGMQVEVLDLGATLRSVVVPTLGGPLDVVLGYDSLEEYRTDRYFVGASLGRFAGRIDRGWLQLDGRDYALTTGGTGGENCLHGGPEGFHARPWIIEETTRQSVRLSLVSESGDQGFPGRLEAQVQYTLLEGFRLPIDFSACTDQVTVVNLSNHAYFNLEGGHGTIGGHRVRIDADWYTPLDERLIPTGEIRTVAGSKFDFRNERALGDCCDVQSDRSCVFDDNFVLNRVHQGMVFAATVAAPATGIRLNVYTTQPGLQFYSGDNLSSPFRPRAGLCLEAQHFPNSPNRPAFPPCRLAPQDSYHHQTLYEFEVADRPPKLQLAKASG